MIPIESDMKQEISIFWFRRDLRLTDNTGLHHALKGRCPVLPVFIFDSNILEQLEDRDDRRVNFIHQAVSALNQQLMKKGASIVARYGTPEVVFKKLLTEYNVQEVYTNHDYEPYAIERDSNIQKLLAKQSIPFLTYKDQVVFEKLEVCKDDRSPYTVFTPYSKKWKSLLTEQHYKAWPVEKLSDHFFKLEPESIPTLKSMQFEIAETTYPPKSLSDELVRKYKQQRDYPAIEGTSRMGVHLRFGTVSIRELVRRSLPLSETYLNELIWREFYQQILWNFPQVGKGHAFRPEYEAIEWRNNEAEFEAWCTGNTGFPIVDAGMRELNATGFMHNRVRMLVASFLSKDLLIDWRWGEAYFARKLLDFDLASNNGGWQWAAGTGCDAAPYFRVFNPYLQTLKFDNSLEYIRRWVPEFESLTYPRPIVDHDFARKRCIEVYSRAIKSFT